MGGEVCRSRWARISFSARGKLLLLQYITSAVQNKPVNVELLAEKLLPSL